MNLSEINIEFILKKLSLLNYQEDIIHNKNSRKNKLKLTSEAYQEKIILWNLSEFEKERIYDVIEWQNKLQEIILIMDFRQKKY